MHFLYFFNQVNETDLDLVSYPPIDAPTVDEVSTTVVANFAQ